MLSLFMLALVQPQPAPTMAVPRLTPAIRVDPRPAPGLDQRCFPPGIARGAKIVAVGSYRGGLPVRPAATFDGSEVNAVRLTAAPTGAPLVLVLSAYDPVLWDVRGIPASRLRALVVYGYDDPAVLGAGHAILRVSASSHRVPYCGEPVHAFSGGRDLDRLDAQVNAIFGRSIDRFLGSYTQRSVAIDGPPGRAGSIADPRRAVGGQAYRTGAQAEGRFGLARLILDGSIRKAAPADIVRLQRALTRRSPTGRLARVQADLSGPTYVVLRPIRVPDGMYGGFSANFLVSPGLPWPADHGSHNRYWSLKDGACRGVSCEPSE